MASTNATAISDDEPLTEAEIEGVLADLAPGAPEAAPEAAPLTAPKRGRGRPPGSRNKPKTPGPGIGAPPPPPRARPRSRGAAKGPTTEQKLLAAWGVPVAALAVAGQVLNNDAFRADAVTAEHYGAGIAKTFAPIAENSPSFVALLDRMSGDAAPWVAAGMVVIGMSAQFAVNHNLIRASSVASFGAVPREVVLGQQLPEGERPAPEPAPAPAPAAPPVVDPWAAGSVPPDWQ